ncbi:MAG TPA: hypothetical protein VF092_28060 [Longimicrobium sp.]
MKLPIRTGPMLLGTALIACHPAPPAPQPYPRAVVSADNPVLHAPAPALSIDRPADASTPFAVTSAADSRSASAASRTLIFLGIAAAAIVVVILATSSDAVY